MMLLIFKVTDKSPVKVVCFSLFVSLKKYFYDIFCFVLGVEHKCGFYCLWLRITLYSINKQVVVIAHLTHGLYISGLFLL